MALATRRMQEQPPAPASTRTHPHTGRGVRVALWLGAVLPLIATFQLRGTLAAVVVALASVPTTLVLTWLCATFLTNAHVRWWAAAAMGLVAWVLGVLVALGLSCSSAVWCGDTSLRGFQKLFFG